MCENQCRDVSHTPGHEPGDALATSIPLPQRFHIRSSLRHDHYCILCAMQTRSSYVDAGSGCKVLGLEVFN